ncbi:MAG TPA: hypothetical protein VFV92_08820 [Candidatus Bathyarchaeia archaeon]|nr:hypothetical protein [Candidatus Bathyarchaeia archaeon]
MPVKQTKLLLSYKNGRVRGQFGKLQTRWLPEGSEAEILDRLREQASK